MEGTGLGSHDRILNSMSRRDVRTGLESLVGADVIDPVELHTSTIERSARLVLLLEFQNQPELELFIQT